MKWSFLPLTTSRAFFLDPDILLLREREREDLRSVQNTSGDMVIGPVKMHEFLLSDDDQVGRLTTYGLLKHPIIAMMQRSTQKAAKKPTFG